MSRMSSTTPLWPSKRHAVADADRLRDREHDAGDDVAERLLRGEADDRGGDRARGEDRGREAVERGELRQRDREADHDDHRLDDAAGRTAAASRAPGRASPPRAIAPRERAAAPLERAVDERRRRSDDEQHRAERGELVVVLAGRTLGRAMGSSSTDMAADRSQASAVRGPGRRRRRDAWRALWTTRAVVWIARRRPPSRCSASATTTRRRTTRGGLTRPFGAFGDALVAPAARWDTRLVPRRSPTTGYDEQRAAFFPLYPLLVKAGGALTGSPLVGGLRRLVRAACSSRSSLLHRLVALDHGREVAALTVLLVAAFPGVAVAARRSTARRCSSLLSVGAVYAARTDRWALAARPRRCSRPRRAASACCCSSRSRCCGGRRAARARAARLALGAARAGRVLRRARRGGARRARPVPRAGRVGPRRSPGRSARSRGGGRAAYDGASRRSSRGDAARRPTPFDPSIAQPASCSRVLAGDARRRSSARIRRLPPAYWLYVARRARAAAVVPGRRPPAHVAAALRRGALAAAPVARAVARRARPRRRAAVVARRVSLVGLALVSALVSTWNWVA